MQCKKCGKEFENKNNVCPFCNNDNNIDNASVENDNNSEIKTDLTTIESSNKEQQKEEKSKSSTDINEIELLIEEPDKPEVVLEPVEQSTSSQSDVTDSKENQELNVNQTENIQTSSAEVQQDNSSVNIDTTTETNDTLNNNIEPEKQPKKINPRMIVFGLIIAVLIIVVILMYMPKKEDSNNLNKVETENNQNEDSKPNDNQVYPENNSNNDINTMFSYTGIYSNDNYEIMMHVANTKNIEIEIIPINNNDLISYSSTYLKLDEENNLVTEDDEFNDEIIKVIRNADESISITASSKEENSIYNLISGTYKKNNNNQRNWAGYYKNNKYDVIIDECDDTIFLYIGKDNTSYVDYFENYTENKIYKKDESFGVTSEITIERTKDVITITSSSTDKEDLENQISGSYTKQN